MRSSRIFADRRAAGRELAGVLTRKHLADPVVLALPRGGVAVAAEIAAALRAPLDIVLVRKIGVPFHSELAAAAVVDGGEPEVVRNEEVIAQSGMRPGEIDAAVRRELAEIERRRKLYLPQDRHVPFEGRTLVVVDDGIATGASIRAALKALRRKKPKALIVAVPVAPPEVVHALEGDADEVVCLSMPRRFHAIGTFYTDFHQMTDDEVIELLARPAGRAEAS